MSYLKKDSLHVRMKILLIPFIACVLFILYIRYLERAAVFFPGREILATPDQVGLSYENIHFDTEDGVRLNGWLMKKADRAPTIIFIHGNAGNIGDRLEKILLFYRMGLNVFIFDYRGYGKSQGTPTEEGIYKDAKAAYDYLERRGDLDPTWFMAYGESLGGAVAIDLATKRKLTCLIADSTFTNAIDIAKRIYPFIPSFLINIKLDSLSKVKTLDTPKLFIHSPEDEMIPYALGRRLYDEAKPPKEFLDIQGTHNEGLSYSQEIYDKGITNFVNKFGRKK